MTLTSSWLPLWSLPVLLLAAAALSIWLYRADRRSCGSLAGWTVTSLRILLLAFISFLLIDPALVKTVDDEKLGEVLVVVDTSPSMEIADGGQEAGSISRLAAAEQLLSSRWAEDLGRQFRLSFHTLSQKLVELPGTPGKLEAATSSGTDLGTPILERALKSPREDLAGIILLSDGNHNAAGDPRQAARSLGTLGIPIISVGIGRTDPPPDLSLEAIEAPGKVFSGDEISAEITLQSTAIEVAELTLNIREGERELVRLVVLSRRGGTVINGVAGQRKMVSSTGDGDAQLAGRRGHIRGVVGNRLISGSTAVVDDLVDDLHGVAVDNSCGACTGQRRRKRSAGPLVGMTTGGRRHIGNRPTEVGDKGLGHVPRVCRRGRKRGASTRSNRSLEEEPDCGAINVNRALGARVNPPASSRGRRQGKRHPSDVALGVGDLVSRVHRSQGSRAGGRNTTAIAKTSISTYFSSINNCKATK